MDEIHDLLAIDKLGDLTLSISVPRYFSGNVLYQITTRGTPRLIKTAEAHSFQGHIVKSVSDIIYNKIKFDNYLLLNNKKILLENIKCYDLDCNFIGNYDTWFMKNKRDLKKKDISNIFKPFEDALSMAIGIDDSKLVNLRLRKTIGDSNIIKLKMSFYGEF